MHNIEDTIGDTGLPVNSIAMANRLIDLLRNHETNCSQSLHGTGLHKYKSVLWLLNQQVYGQLGTIDMSREWHILSKEGRKEGRKEANR